MWTSPTSRAWPRIYVMTASMWASSSSCTARCASSTFSIRTGTGSSSRKSSRPAEYPPGVIVQAGPQDVRFLRDMLKHAYHWRLNEDPDLPVARYVNQWGRPGDAGLIAWEAGPVGAAWYPLFPASAPGFGLSDEGAPELSIARGPRRHGR